MSPSNRHVVRVAELPQTPWRNGGGTTTAIAAEPEGASFDDCLWRIDLSDIGRSGPFSHLAGLDRVIVPLDSGLVLTVAGVRHTLTAFEPFAFSGDDVTTCEIDLPMQAFNLMVRRGEAVGMVLPRPGAGRVAGPGVLILYVASGIFSVVEGGYRPRRLEAGSAIVVRASDRPVGLEPVGAGSLALSTLVRPV